MKKPFDQLPVTLEAPGTRITSEAFGNMTVAYTRIGKGTDFTPLLEGLPRDHTTASVRIGAIIKSKSGKFINAAS